MLLYHIPGNFASNRIAKVRLKLARQMFTAEPAESSGLQLAVKLVEEELRERAQRPME